MFSPNENIAVIGFPKIVIKLKEYHDILNEIKIKKIKNGVASLESFNNLIPGDRFCIKKIIKMIEMRCPKLINLPPDGIVDSMWANE